MVSTSIKLQVPIEAPHEEVVARLCDFGAIDQWHPVFTESRLEGTGPGAVRTLRMGKGWSAIALDEVGDAGQGYRYTQLDGPVGARKHRGYLWVSRTKHGSAIVEWAAKVTDPVLPGPVVQQILEAVVSAGLNAAKRSLEGVRP
ncbi:MAG: SRPBCC family protein [Sandaracinaceae bacterium]